MLNSMRETLKTLSFKMGLFKDVFFEKLISIHCVIPAQAGIQTTSPQSWIPACAGMTKAAFSSKKEKPVLKSERDASGTFRTFEKKRASAKRSPNPLQRENWLSFAKNSKAAFSFCRIIKYLVFLSFPFLQNCALEKESANQETAFNLPEKADFRYHVKPILSDRCFTCHGPDENARKANLRLDLAENAYAALGKNNDRFAIVPGDREQSQLVHRISSDDPEMQMPPPESNLSLDEREIALLARWIEQGAEYQPHWAFIPPEKPELPEVQAEDWPSNEIDRFILAKLEQENLSPTVPTQRETWLRRVTFDLTGLPPTIEEIDVFLTDESENAHEKVIDRLLESPHYGERMAVEWLDAARYADSHGYQDDGFRNMWPWRDWVIEKFNQNLPFDDFITWQLAGDLLENPTDEQILATGFNRNHMQSQEGGIVEEEYRTEYVADRVNTFGKAFLGVTMECARCHDHKYDPISQEEYFQLFAFFNQVNESGVAPYVGEASPTLILLNEAEKDTLAGIREKVAALEEQIAPANFDEGFNQWLNQLENAPDSGDFDVSGLLAHLPLDSVATIEAKDEKGSRPKQNIAANSFDSEKPARVQGLQKDHPIATAGKHGGALEFVGDGHIDLNSTVGYFERNEPFTLSIWLKTLADSVEGPLVTKTGGLFDGNRGYTLELRKEGRLFFSLNHNAPDNAIAKTTKTAIPQRNWANVVLTYDGSSRAKGLNVYLNGALMATETEADHLWRSTLSYGPKKLNWMGNVNVRLGRLGEQTLDNAALDDFRIYGRRLTSLEIARLAEKEINFDAMTAETLNNENQGREALREYYLSRVDTMRQAMLDSLTKLRGEENAFLSVRLEVMVMKDRAHPRKTHILHRGQYDAPTQEVTAGTPAALGGLPEDLPRNRLGLAKWLTNPEHPMTARVIVNRIWQMHFGRGLVDTADDFGNQGALPSHPELLDWLAVHFVESEWDVKALHKLILSSATYRQASEASDALLEKDPENRLLARGPSYRLPAEMVRDNALAVSGLLVPNIGGPSVKPYQPDGLWKETATRNATNYEQDSGEKLYRRSMYTIWKRSSPPPSMISFDASERNLCTVKRQKTSTPLQALVLLNDPQYVEAARILAERMLKEGGEKPEEQIAFGFKLTAGREPSEREIQILQELYENERQTFESDSSAVRELLKVGEFAHSSELDNVQIAAQTMVANTLMSFDAFVMKR